MSDNLFSAYTLGSTTLSNRMVMAPMTRNRAPEGMATPLMAEYYAQRASAGLIITEGAQISPQGVGYPATPGIYNDAQVASWKPVTDAVHAKGSRIFVQLWHCGRVSHPDFHHGALPVAPSAIQPQGQAFTYEGLKDFVTPRALSVEEISGIVEDYRHAAVCAIQAGFDGVEIHAANGYLIDQFLRDGSNQRQDQYGGSIENRSRFLLEVTAAVIEAIGADKVGVRLSPINAFNDMQDSAPQTLFTHVAAALSTLKPSYLHVVEVSMTGESDSRFDMTLLRHAFNGCYIANGGYDKARGNQVLNDGNADLIAYGIPFLANPDLPARFAQDADLNAPDQATFYGGDAHGYTDYPSLGEQS
jgi:N-ethylmaleimide reductase